MEKRERDILHGQIVIEQGRNGFKLKRVDLDLKLGRSGEVLAAHEKL